MSSAGIQVFTVNIGNTHTSALAWPWRSKPEWHVWPTDGASAGLQKLLKQTRNKVPVVLGGVVPARKQALRRKLTALGCRVLIFRQHLKPRLKIVPQPPEAVGDDRIAGALGALALDDTRSWVVVDAGTALTINAVTPASRSKLPRFEGGLIVPGAELGLWALAHDTAQLPPLHGRTRDGACVWIGRSTAAAMRCGVRQAQLATAIALAQGQLRQLRGAPKVVLTGGGADDRFQNLFRRAFAPGQAVVCRHLVHLGLFKTWEARAAKPEGQLSSS